ncbi:type VI secretion system-associated FHA domain protein TagH [Pseudomonas sp. LD120]|uniref:type VI secretion system-associated FHA domain protein TagH n=1 Tax=Pseudomonas sp. LD120 TaxID=485751 RepID=UPI0013589214|nr:type VI secretion system-associated FHA domain protein TagH [Pseudomonas sp. LD120]KAF0864226.1 type VI secretion system-associated FHA domain protein TagH [Pseudomonas sp. LD120]
MELVFEMLDIPQRLPAGAGSKTFRQAGGTIGRSEDCDWVLPDRKRHLSNHHARISYREGGFFLTDTSSNGVMLKDTGARLRKGEALRIEHGSTFVLGGYAIRARLVPSATLTAEVGRALPAGSIIPDDAFLDLDPLKALEQQEQGAVTDDPLALLNSSPQTPRPFADYARIDTESLVVPELVAPPVAAARLEPAPDLGPGEVFWEQFGSALGVDLKGLEQDERQAVAIKAAALLKQSVSSLQQSLRTRSELKNELRLAQTVTHRGANNPLRYATDAGEALGRLLLDDKPGQLPASQAIARAFGDLQAHQVALLAASRAAVRSTLEHFSPQLLTLRFERDGKRPWLATSGRRWRAYTRYHQSLRQDDDWSERLLARDFAQAYEEQHRLISTLNTESHQG